MQDDNVLVQVRLPRWLVRWIDHQAVDRDEYRAHTMRYLLEWLVKMGGSNPCQRCGGPCFFEVVLPDDVWNQIANPDGNGYFCLLCMDEMCYDKGIETEGQFYWSGRAIRSALYKIDDEGLKDENRRLKERVQKLEDSIREHLLCGHGSSLAPLVAPVLTQEERAEVARRWHEGPEPFYVALRRWEELRWVKD